MSATALRLLLLVLWTLAVNYETAHAYIGPGAGFAVVNIFGFALVTIFLTMLGVAFFPFRYLKRKIQNRGLPSIPRNVLKTKKVVVLGLDGMDPDLVARMIKEGKLPNLASFAENGGFSKLRTTTPPQSPVAWSTFVTGCNPGKHGIFDFLHRNPANYLPSLSLADIKPPKRFLKIGRWRVPLSGAVIKQGRQQIPFWHILGRLGVRVAVQRVPATFPPEKFDGRLLSAMGIPDLIGSQGTFTWVTSAPSGDIGEEGRIVRARREAGMIRFSLEGPDDPFIVDRKPVSIDFEAEIKAGKTLLRFQGKTVILEENRFSDWITLKFKTAPGLSICGLARFVLICSEPEFNLYITPINIDPENPALPISHPGLYSKYLAMKTGPFSTLGLAEDTSAFNAERLSPGLFLEMCENIFSERTAVLRAELEKFRSGLVVNVLDTTDRVAHMFWQYMDPEHPKYNAVEAERWGGTLESVYEKCDSLVGEIHKQLDDDSLFIILSDHGFNTFRHAVNLNDWLIANGYMHLREGCAAGGMKFLNRVNWSKTAAYAIGLNGIYINRRGREAKGMVEEAEADDVMNRLAKELSDFTHLGNGCSPVKTVKRSSEIFHGPFTRNAPDLQIGYARHYRGSWQTMLGGAAGKIITPNLKNWSGDHCIDADSIPGVLFCNRPIKADNPSLEDIAPTVLKEFGLDAPEQMDGRSFL